VFFVVLIVFSGVLVMFFVDLVVFAVVVIALSVFGYPVFSLVGELGSDDAWFLLLRFLHLPLTTGLSLGFACLAVSESALTLL